MHMVRSEDSIIGLHSTYIIVVLSSLRTKKFDENFGEFLMHLLFGVAIGDEGCSDFPLCFPLCR